jgi:hypothetical protein
MANLDDVVTVQKNGVVAVNALVQALSNFRDIYSNVMGGNSAIGISSDALVATGPGRLVTVSVITAASGGTIHDTDTVANATNANAIYTIPSSTGATVINFPFFDGLVIKPAATSVVSVSFSED